MLDPLCVFPYCFFFGFVFLQPTEAYGLLHFLPRAEIRTRDGQSRGMDTPKHALVPVIRESHGGGGRSSGRVTPVELKPPPRYEDMEDEVWTLAQRCYRRKVMSSFLY